MSVTPAARVAARPRAFVRAAGPHAEDYLQRMISNDVAALAVGASCDALLLTAKSRVIAPLRVLRRGQDDFLLLTEAELGERVRSELLRFRFAARVDIEAEEHASTLVFGASVDGIPNDDYGEPGFEVLDTPVDGETIDDDRLERMRIEAGTPRWGREIDDRVLPAEAGLDVTHVSFTKGCYPGQEPIARLHHRGHANRGLRVLYLEGGAATPETELRYEGKPVGRITSAAGDVALAYVRTEVPEEAALDVGQSGSRVIVRARPLGTS